MTMGINAFTYQKYVKEKERQEARDKAYAQLNRKSLQVVQRYKNIVERKWNHRPFLYKLWTFGLEPIRLIVAREVLEKMV